jgi:nitroimidazol reductase NimA-like FMN-containing flavoprotein (pyridoxamine 5'-phosphate oxidase superfamily)
MNQEDLLTFIRRHTFAAVATANASGGPQVAIVRFVATPQFEIVFDTTEATRKAKNLRQNPKVAIAIGWDESQSIQIEGLADEPRDGELDRVKKAYSESYPKFFHARQRAKGLVYFRVRPNWMCHGDFRQNPASIVTYDVLAGDLRRTLEPFLGDGATEHPDHMPRTSG